MVNLYNADQINEIIYFLDRCNSNNWRRPEELFGLVLRFTLQQGNRPCIILNFSVRS